MRYSKFRQRGGLISSAILGVFLILLLMVQLPSTAHANEDRVGIDVTSSGAHGDVSVAGIDVEYRGADVDEFSAVGVDVLFEGRASGDVSIAAVDAVVDADVGGDLSVAAAEVQVRAAVGGEVSLAGAEVHFAGSAASADIAGAEVHVDGIINGNLSIAAEELTITPTTTIAGDFRFEGPEEPVLPEGLTIGGNYTYEYRDFEEWVDGEVPVVLFPIVAMAGLTGAIAVFMLLGFSVLIGGGVLMLLMTGLTARTIDGIRQKPLSSMGMGLMVLFGLLVIAALLCVTVIGIPLAFAILAFYPVLLLVGFIVATLGVPYLIFRRDPRETGAFAKIGLFVVSVLALVFLFALPGVGQIAFSLIVLMGVGAFGAAVLGGREQPAA